LININTSTFKVQILSDKDDLEQCLDLLISSFTFVSKADLKQSMGFFLNNAPKLTCLIIKFDNKIVALQCILDRKMSFFGIPIKIAGMSYAAIDKKFQNSEVGRELKIHLFNYINENADLSLGFARKAMDNYWYPYGYRGVTNFCEIKITIPKSSKTIKSFSTREAKDKDIKKLIQWYNSTYENMVGPLFRDINLWKYYLKKVIREKNKILIIVENNIDIGYCLLNNNYVLELGYNYYFQNKIIHFLFQIIRNDNFKEIVFKCGATHPIVELVQKFEFSISKRYVWRGGHIAKINDINYFLNYIKFIIEKRLLNYKIKDFEFSCNSFLFCYYNSSLNINHNYKENSDITFENSEWTKLIFGVVSCKNLFGFIGNEYEHILNIMFPEFNPQFPDLDQF
jgi:hypothetical protein